MPLESKRTDEEGGQTCGMGGQVRDGVIYFNGGYNVYMG